MEKLSKRKKILNLISFGKKLENSFFKVYILNNNSLNEPKLYITNISKKAIKKSSKRNLCKRRIRAIFNKLKNNLKPYEFLIMPKNTINQLDTFEKIQENLVDLLLVK